MIDSSIAPAIFANVDAPEGVFTLNCVLLRIEVKSKLTRKGLSDFIEASSDLARMKFRKQPDCKSKFTHPFSILVAFASDSSNKAWDFEYERFRSLVAEKSSHPLLSGFVSSLCIVQKGFWFLKDFERETRSWCRFDTTSETDRLAWLVAYVSSSAYRAHAERQGRDPSEGLETGIASYLPPPKFLMVNDPD